MPSPYRILWHYCGFVLLLFMVFAIFGGSIGRLVGVYMLGIAVAAILGVAPVLCWCELRAIRERMDVVWPCPQPPPEPAVNPPGQAAPAVPPAPAVEPYVSRNAPSPMDHLPDDSG